MRDDERESRAIRVMRRTRKNARSSRSYTDEIARGRRRWRGDLNVATFLFLYGHTRSRRHAASPMTWTNVTPDIGRFLDSRLSDMRRAAIRRAGAPVQSPPRRLQRTNIVALIAEKVLVYGRAIDRAHAERLNESDSFVVPSRTALHFARSLPISPTS